MGWNSDVGAVKDPSLQRLIDASMDVLHIPALRELPSLVTISVDYRGKQEAGVVLYGFGVSVSDRSRSDEADTLYRRTN